MAFIRVLAIFTLVLGVASCSKKTKPDDLSAPTTDADQAGGFGDSDSGGAMGLQTVHFPFDSFVLDDTAKKTLRGNAQTLKDHSALKIQVEGHCDQRGGIQYNIALGERRANAIRDSLKKQGIAGDRITTISYGKERILDMNMTEEAFGKNRRGNFVITAK